MAVITKKISAAPDVRMKAKKGFITVCMLLAAVGLIFYLGNIMLNKNKEYQSLANDLHFREMTVPAMRGTIYSSNVYADSIPLAESSTVYTVLVNPKQFEEQIASFKKKEKAKETEALKKGNSYIPLDIDKAQADLVDYLVRKIGINAEDFNKKLGKTKSQYEIVKKNVSKDMVREINAYTSNFGDPDLDDGKNIGYNLVAVYAEEGSKRYYPQSTLAAPIVGFLTETEKYGVENSYDKYLAGTNGVTITAADAFGNEMDYRNATRRAAVDGSDVYLTIDRTLQSSLEKYVAEMAIGFETKNRSAAIMMNAKTGAILAMATYPSFDLNHPYDLTYTDHTRTTQFYTEKDGVFVPSGVSKTALNDKIYLNQLANYGIDDVPDAYEAPWWDALYTQWRNKGISDTYVPGSVFKVFTSASAFEKGVLHLDDHFSCGGATTVGGTEFHCWTTAGHGGQDFKLALTNSCNPAFIEIGRRLGAADFLKYLDAFGISEGSKTGIDLPGEVTSQTVNSKTPYFDPVGLASSAFGQTNKLTPIQMITMYAATINGGYLVTPHVVDKIVGTGERSGEIVFEFGTQVKRQVVSEKTSALMRESLEAVVNNKGGTNANIKGYHIGGKSGTSQKLDEYPKLGSNGISEDVYISSYVCFAPANDPEVILLVMADEPNNSLGYYGSIVAVPTARNILTDTLPYLGFYPEYSEEEARELEKVMPLVEGKNVDDARKTLQLNSFGVKIVGDGATVLRQVPEPNEAVPNEGRVILYTDNSDPETSIVPNVAEMTIAQANIELANLDINFIVKGASKNNAEARVKFQSIPPGTIVNKGTVIELTFLVANESG